MNKYLKIFLQNAILGGLFIGIIKVLLELEEYKLSGLIYGALPIGFIFILITYYFSGIDGNQKKDILLHFSNYSIIGGFLFIVIIASYFYALRYTGNHYMAVIALIVSSILFTTITVVNLPILK